MKLKSFIPDISILIFLIITSFVPPKSKYLKVEKGSNISVVGGNLGSRLINYDYFEPALQLLYPNNQLIVRNMCDGGDTPGFRPHSARKTSWAFPGAEKFQTEFANPSDNQGHFPYPDEWLTSLKTDIVIGIFGYSESQKGLAGLNLFKGELQAFINHTKTQKYNGIKAPQLAIVSSIAIEDLTKKFDLPNGIKENKNLQMYSLAMKEICQKNNVLFVDAFNASKKWYAETEEYLTIDGQQLTDTGYQKFSQLLVNELFGKEIPTKNPAFELVKKAVDEKNWFWHNDYKIPNGVHVYGRRYDPFGPDNYPAEIEKIRQMTAIRDTAIWMATHGETMNLALADSKTRTLPPVKTNYDPGKNGSLKYLTGEEAVSKIKTDPDYKIELFASEADFPELVKPMQMAFDNKGRLWVACMPTYPHWKPGDPRPNDKLVILEDTNNDGKADKVKVFADQLHLPLGFEFAPEGVYVSQGTNLVLLTDIDGDDKADKKEVILSGYDDHDTHHNSHSYTMDPSGAFYSGEGVFLHTNIETPYGTVRATNGGYYRYSPQLKKLERTAQIAIPNPWGVLFDDWGQPIFAETSSPDVRWLMPSTSLPRYGESNHKSDQLIEKNHMVRPTSGIELISSRHFPDDVQGDLLINNTIGFLGTKQHTLKDDVTGYKSQWVKDLIVSEDKNFRPVDLEFAPDGSLYIIDWHNILIGHMQHNARDPLRDHEHGRVYRITHKTRPLVTPAHIDGATIEELLENLKLPEYRSRYRTKRELRARPAAEVLPKLTSWVNNLDKNDPNYEHNMLEALWVSWGLNKVDQPLLRQLLKAKDYHSRAAAVMVLRYTGHQVLDQANLLMQAVKDENSRVRLTAIVAASWLEKSKGLPILVEAKKKPMDELTQKTFEKAFAHLSGVNVRKMKEEEVISSLKGKDLELYKLGKSIYAKDGYCQTCHQADGNGLSASQFPPLSGATKWVIGNEERLIKLVLKGIMGPIEVNGRSYPGQVPMTPFGGLLNDKEVAAVLTYVRNSFGNKASTISPEKVKAVRATITDKKDFYSPAKLLEDHPWEKWLVN
jgi:mono/diheme cytochrome c family protein/glucose/arabinose dehydrogenase